MYSDEVLLDNDFCNMFHELNKSDSKINVDELYNKMILQIGKKPCIHKYIADSELLLNPFIQEKIKKNDIRIIDFTEILKEDDSQIYYESLFMEYYKFLKGKEFTGDVFKSRMAGESYGEIHSLITAFFLGIPIFLSNDNGAKLLANKKINTQNNINVQVISGFDFLTKYETIFSTQERKVIISLQKWKERWKKFKEQQTEIQ